MGIPAVPLGELYTAGAWSRHPNVRLHLRTPVERLCFSGGQLAEVVAAGHSWKADFIVSALSFERLQQLTPELTLPSSDWSHSPITGIHLWFDRPVTQLPHATLLDRTIQWMFNKDQGRYLQLVVSASRSLIEMSRQDVIDLACRELAEFLPAVSQARLEKAHVVKEVRATFSATPAMEAQRPESPTRFRNFFLAGDWTKSGWPATMEGAVRSGYLAAEAVCAAAGTPRRILLPDIA
jgi:zeta-carotene desaturase